MSITVTMLGTGTSAGVPMIGCTCEVCTSDDPHDRRDRPSVMVCYDDEGYERTFLIDTTPDLRHQMIRNDVMRIDGVFYTHNHADHVFGLDDLRRFNAVMGTAIDIYAERGVLDWLHGTFGYIFEPHLNVNKTFIAELIPNEVFVGEGVELYGKVWQPIRLLHGRLPILGFRIGGFAYCTDCSSIPPETYAALDDLDVLVIDGLRYRHHPTHMTVDRALGIIEELRPRRGYLTHIAHDIKHADLEARLPDGVFLAYDGLVLEVEG